MPETCPHSRGGEKSHRWPEMWKPLLCIPSHFLSLQKPSWESHRDFHNLRKSQGIPREKVCGCSHCPLATHLGGDTSAAGTPDLPSMQPWGAHIRRPIPSLLSSTEYSWRCSSLLFGIPSPLCRNTVLSIGFPDTLWVLPPLLHPSPV